jgi:hypothetical protein
MRLISSLLGLKIKTEELFDKTNGKSIAEHKRELLIRAGRQQFEKLTRLGLNVPIRLA